VQKCFFFLFAPISIVVLVHMYDAVFPWALSFFTKVFHVSTFLIQFLHIYFFSSNLSFLWVIFCCQCYKTSLFYFTLNSILIVIQLRYFTLVGFALTFHYSAVRGDTTARALFLPIYCRTMLLFQFQIIVSYLS
jgi:hypothetical protein